MVPQGRQTLKSVAGEAAAVQTEHPERLIQRRHQTLGTEVIGGDKAIVAAAEDAKTGSHPNSVLLL